MTGALTGIERVWFKSSEDIRRLGTLSKEVPRGLKDELSLGIGDKLFIKGVLIGSSSDMAVSLIKPIRILLSLLETVGLSAVFTTSAEAVRNTPAEADRPLGTIGLTASAEAVLCGNSGAGVGCSFFVLFLVFPCP